MKRDTAMEALKDTPIVAGVAASFTLQEYSILVAIVVGIVTIAYTAVRMAHALRKWYLEEKYRKFGDKLSSEGE